MPTPPTWPTYIDYTCWAINPKTNLQFQYKIPPKHTNSSKYKQHDSIKKLGWILTSQQPVEVRNSRLILKKKATVKTDWATWLTIIWSKIISDPTIRSHAEPSLSYAVKAALEFPWCSDHFSSLRCCICHYCKSTFTCALLHFEFGPHLLFMVSMILFSLFLPNQSAWPWFWRVLNLLKGSSSTPRLPSAAHKGFSSRFSLKYSESSLVMCEDCKQHYNHIKIKLGLYC